MAQKRSSSALEPLEPGLYELLITAGLQDRLNGLDDRLVIREGLHRAEAADRIALHLGLQIKRALADLPESERVEAGVSVARALLERLEEIVRGADISSELLAEPGQLLRALTTFRPDGTARPIDGPLIPLDAL